MNSLSQKHAVIFTAICFTFFALCFTSSAQAAPANTQTVNLNEMTELKRLELAKFLLENGQANTAIQAITFKSFTTKQHIIIAENILADSLFAIGKKSEAIVVLRRLLSADPSLTPSRYKLAQMLFATEDDAAAKHHFLILRDSIKSEQGQNAIAQYLKQVDLRKRWFFNVGGNVVPQSNINGGSSKDIYYCEDTASTPEGIESWKNLLAAFGLDCTAGIPIAAADQAQSGSVISANITGGYRFRLTEDASWTIRGTSEYTYYPKASGRANSISFALDTGPTISLSNATRLDINGTASITVANKAITQKHFGLSATFNHVFSSKVSGSLSSSLARTTVVNNTDYSHYKGSVNASTQISIDNSSFIRIMAGFARTKYTEPNLSYWQVNGGLGYYKEFAKGITIYSQADLSYKSKPLEAITNYNFNVKLSKRDFNFFGFTPQLIYNYNRSDSNINRNDTHAHSFSMGITRSF